MKIIFKAFLLVSLLTGCASVTFLPTDESVKFAPTNSIKIYWKEPKNPYNIIGKVSAESGDLGEETLFKKLKHKAMAVGAHAIIMRGTSQQSSIVGAPMYGGGTLIIPVSSTQLNALAIRFTE